MNESSFLKLFMGFISACFVIAAFLMPDRANAFSGLWQIMSQPGKITTNYFHLGGYAATFLNMGLVGLISLLLFVILKANVTNVSTLAFILTLGFCSYGMSILNIIPLMTILGVDRLPLSFGKDLESVDFLAENWRSYKYTPKAANMMLIIYRNREGKVLVRPRVNERDVELDMESATPHYYDWEAFKKYAYARLDIVDLLKKR